MRCHEALRAIRGTTVIRISDVGIISVQRIGGATKPSLHNRAAARSLPIDVETVGMFSGFTVSCPKRCL